MNIQLLLQQDESIFHVPPSTNIAPLLYAVQDQQISWQWVHNRWPWQYLHQPLPRSVPPQDFHSEQLRPKEWKSHQSSHQPLLPKGVSSNQLDLTGQRWVTNLGNFLGEGFLRRIQMRVVMETIITLLLRTVISIILCTLHLILPHSAITSSWLLNPCCLKRQDPGPCSWLAPSDTL